MITRLALGAALVLVQSAVACPVCRTDTGEAVRSGIFNSSFGFNLVVTLLPFAFFYGIAALVYYGPPSFLVRPEHNDVSGVTLGAEPTE